MLVYNKDEEEREAFFHTTKENREGKKIITQEIPKKRRK